MKKTQADNPAAARAGERGAALITALLVSMLLLTAGGALLFTTAMTATNAVDSTAEAQAYYAADAGLQAALTVMRRNVNATNPAGTTADFHNFVCGTANACTNTGGDLSPWLSYSANGAVKLSDTPYAAYSVRVRDSSKLSTDTLAASYQPRFLVVQSVGHGPHGATKVMEMMVDRFIFAYDAPATLVLRESQDGSNHVNVSPGPAQPNTYSGTDFSNPTVTKPAVGVGQSAFNGNTDLALATVAMATENMTGGVAAVGTAASPWPSIVTDAATAYKTVHGDPATKTKGLADYATSTACPGSSTALSGFTYIEGDCTLGPQNSGSGFLVVTGTLTVSGNFNFSGVIFALGTGKIVHKGGGGSIIEGGILAANFGTNGTGGFGPVSFDTSGGGNSTIRYNSQAINNALAIIGPRTLGVVEK